MLAPLGVKLLLGQDFVPSISIVRWMAMLPFVVALSNILGIQTMLTFGMGSEFSKILLVSGILNLLILVPLASAFAAEGAAIAVMITEVIVTIAMLFVLRYKGYKLFIGGSVP
jgi:O-antigen/teichoic acid export membrane protein